MLAAGVGSLAPAGINDNHIHSACALNLRMHSIAAMPKTVLEIIFHEFFQCFCHIELNVLNHFKVRSILVQVLFSECTAAA